MRLLVVLALAVPLALAGCDKKAAPVKADPVAVAGDKSPVPITVDGDGFKPSSVKFKRGVPATLVFTRTTDETCATEVVFPQLDIRKELPKGQAVSITIPTDKDQKLSFQCGMGMYKSSVVVAVD